MEIMSNALNDKVENVKNKSTKTLVHRSTRTRNIIALHKSNIQNKARNTRKQTIKEKWSTNFSNIFAVFQDFTPLLKKLYVTFL